MRSECCWKILAGRNGDPLNLIVTPLDLTSVSESGGLQMLQQIWDTFVMLIPVFFLLTMIFGAGFYIGRVSKKE